MSLNASTVFPRELSESDCPHRGEQQFYSPAGNALSCSLAHLDVHTFGQRRTKPSHCEAGSCFVSLSLFFTFSVGMCGLWVSEAAGLCTKQEKTAFPWDKDQIQTIWF